MFKLVHYMDQTVIFCRLEIKLQVGNVSQVCVCLQWGGYLWSWQSTPPVSDPRYMGPGIHGIVRDTVDKSPARIMLEGFLVC